MPPTSLIGGTKSAVRQLQKSSFQPRVKQDEFSSMFGDRAVDVLEELEIQRTKVTTELNKLIFALEDPAVPIKDEKEILAINDEANRKQQLKFSIELDITRMTRGERDYIPNELKGKIGEYRWFGRAKDVGAADGDRREAVARAVADLAESAETREVSKADLIEAAVEKKEASGKVKRGRFDLDLSDESEEGDDQEYPVSKRPRR